MLAAMALFVSNDALLKLASATYPTGQVMAYRGIFATLFALALVFGMRENMHLRRLLSPLVALRAALEAATAFLFITALAFLPLANITAILQTTPIIMTVLAVALGIERVGWRRWAAIVVGFAGVLLIVRPGAQGFDVYALVALASALLVALRDLVTRRIRAEIPSSVVTLSTVIGVALAGVVVNLASGEPLRPFLTPQVLPLLGAALLVTLGNLTVIMAFRLAEVSVVSPFRYSNVVLSILLGFLIFGELPDLFACAGIALIAGSGIYAIHREQVRQRAEQAQLAERARAAA